MRSAEARAELRRCVAVEWATGISTLAIGRKLGVSKNSVCGIVRRLNLPMRATPDLARAWAAPRVRVVKAKIRALPAVYPAFDRIPNLTRPAAADIIDGPTTADPGRGCLWPMWARGSVPRPALYCGQVRAGRSYCAGHRALACSKVPVEEAA